MRAPLLFVACLALAWSDLAHCQDAAAIRHVDPLAFGLQPREPLELQPAGDLIFESGTAQDSQPQQFFASPGSVPVHVSGDPLPSDEGWLRSLDVGYDNGFIVASRSGTDLDVSERPFVIKLNGWGQLRHTNLDSRSNDTDLNQFQLKRARLVFSGNVFEPEFRYFIQLDGRSTDGDSVRLLDYYLSYDAGHVAGGLKPGVFNARIGRYKMPFHMARWMSGKEFEFSDRSVASTFFDVNRSLACGFFGASSMLQRPFDWEVAIFNGLVTGGAETGSTGTLDDNFAYSGRLFVYPKGDWGSEELADFTWHEELAVRMGGGFAGTKIDRVGATEFQALRVVDTGVQLSSLLPAEVTQYDVRLFAVHVSTKYRGLSTTLEYYFRTTDGFEGADLAQLNDHGFWLQLGQFVVPGEWQILSRWSRVVGTSGSLGASDQSTEEIGLGLARYFEKKNAKFVIDVNYLNGSPISSPTLDISPGDEGFLYRSQLQFSF